MYRSSTKQWKDDSATTSQKLTLQILYAIKCPEAAKYDAEPCAEYLAQVFTVLCLHYA